MEKGTILHNTFKRLQYLNNKYLPHFSNSGIVGLFMISPLLSFPYITYRSFKGNKVCQILFSTFLGLLSICFVPPRADLYRHYLMFNQINGHDLNFVIENLRFDIILPLLQYIISHCGLNFEVIRLILIFIPYYLFFQIYNSLKGKNDTHNIKIFLYCLFSIPFMETTLGLRYGSAISIIAYVAIRRFLIGEKMQMSYYILLIIGPCIHFATIWFSLLVLCKPIIPKNIGKLKTIGLLVLSYILSYFFEDLLKFLIFNNATEQLVNHYGTNGVYGERYIFHNFIGSIPEYYNYFIVYSIIFIFCLKIPYNPQTAICWLVMIIWGFTHELYTISGRMDMIISVLCPIYIYKYASWVYKRSFLKILILGALLVAIINWRAWTVSYPLYILFPPFLILTIGYDNEWLSTFVDRAGTLKIYKR